MSTVNEHESEINRLLDGLADEGGWWREKAPQVSPSALVAFGIVVESRLGKASELVALLQLAENLAKRDEYACNSIPKLRWCHNFGGIEVFLHDSVSPRSIPELIQVLDECGVGYRVAGSSS